MIMNGHPNTLDTSSLKQKTLHSPDKRAGRTQNCSQYGGKKHLCQESTPNRPAQSLVTKLNDLF